MPLSERYRHQVALLIETLPFVAPEKDFALKGGTAINLFVRDMPRLSVDSLFGGDQSGGIHQRQKDCISRRRGGSVPRIAGARRYA